MQAFFQTRGRHTDYRFLGEEPADRWWTHYGRATSFEERTAIVEAYAGRWQLYLSAIPSARRDRVNTPIRWTIVVEGACDGPSAAALDLLRSWFDAPERLGALLDEVAPEARVEALLERAGAAAALSIALDALVGAVGDAQRHEEADDGSSWAGGVHAPRCCEAFVTRATSLLRGRLEGTAAVLNLLGEPDEVGPDLMRGGTLAVLLESGEPELRKLSAQKKNERVSRPPPRSVPPPPPVVAPPPGVVDPGVRARAAVKPAKSWVADAVEQVYSTRPLELRLELEGRVLLLELRWHRLGWLVSCDGARGTLRDVVTRGVVWTHLDEAGILYPKDAPRMLERIHEAWMREPLDDLQVRVSELAAWIAACHAAAPAEARAARWPRGR